MKITQDILYVGVDDKDIDLFEGHYIVPDGMMYNSYVIADDKIAVMDAVDRHFTDEWLGKVKEATGGKAPDYLIVQHMEPDHSGKHYRFHVGIPSGYGGFFGESLHHDEELLRNGLRGQTRRCRRGR